MKLVYATAAIQGLTESALKTESEEELLLSRKRGKLRLQRVPQKKRSLDKGKQG